MHFSRIAARAASFAAALLISTAAFAADTWSVDFDAARKQAKEENKAVLLNFSGSDWCGWCIRLDKEVFATEEWQQFAKDRLVLVKVDFPRRTELPAEQLAANEKLAEKFKIEGFPTIIITSPSGRKIGELGYVRGGPKAFIAQLEPLLK